MKGRNPDRKNIWGWDVSDIMRERSPGQSKKFIAFVIAEVTWKAALLVLLVMGIHAGTVDIFLGSIALALIVVAGFVEALYIGGQASLDKYVRVAEIAADAGHRMSIKGITVEPTYPPSGTVQKEDEPK